MPLKVYALRLLYLLLTDYYLWFFPRIFSFALNGLKVGHLAPTF
jgi:hypothetical protein